MQIKYSLSEDGGILIHSSKTTKAAFCPFSSRPCTTTCPLLEYVEEPDYVLLDIDGKEVGTPRKKNPYITLHCGDGKRWLKLDNTEELIKA